MNCYNGGGTSTVTVQTLPSFDAPAAVGFNTSIRYTTNSTAIILIQPGHYIEGLNISDFRWGTTNASLVVLSFWLKSNAAFTIAVSLRNAIAGGTWTGYVTTISSTTVWNYYTLQIPGATIGSWNINTSTGLEIFIGGYSGVAGVSTINVWSNNGGSISSTTSTRWDQTVGNYIEFTGLQLEKGTIATPFEFRPYAIEMQLCQRYFVGYGSQGSNARLAMGNWINSTSGYLYFQPPTEMRSIPSLSYSAMGRVVLESTNWYTVTALSLYTAETSTKFFMVLFNVASSAASATVITCIGQGAIIYFSAEL